EDNDGHWSLGSVYIEVRAVVRDDGYTTAVNHPLTVKAPGFFANDRGFDDSTLDHDDVTWNNGEIDVNDDGSFTYTPPPGYKGDDTFTYTVADDNGDNLYTATVHIGVGVAPKPSPTPAPPNSTPPNPPGPGPTTAPGQQGPGPSVSPGNSSPGNTTPG